MIVAKMCPHCNDTTTCFEYETTNYFYDDILEVSTEYVCTKCHCYFSEKMRYTVHYEDTEIEIIEEGEQ